MIDNGGITLYNAVDGEVGTVTSVGDFFILEDSQGGFDCFGCRGTSLEKSHSHLGGPIIVSQGTHEKRPRRPHATQA